MHKTKKGYRLQLTCSGTGRKSYAVYAIKKVLLEEKIWVQAQRVKLCAQAYTLLDYTPSVYCSKITYCYSFVHQFM
jgi:hypothetical protein